MTTVRPAEFPRDAAGIEALDTSFETDVVFRAQAGGDGIALRAERLPAPVVKRFPLEDLYAAERPWSASWVAETEGRIIGFAATSYMAWNVRALLWHFYVAPDWRGQGLGRRLMTEVLACARDAGARNRWLETSNLNVPGVNIYRRLGFELTGLDLTLYDGTPAEGEFALFLSRPV